MPLIMGFLTRCSHELLYATCDGNHSKVKLLSDQRWLLQLLQAAGNPPSCQA